MHRKKNNKQKLEYKNQLIQTKLSNYNIICIWTKKGNNIVMGKYNQPKLNMKGQQFFFIIIIWNSCNDNDLVFLMIWEYGGLLEPKRISVVGLDWLLKSSLLVLLVVINNDFDLYNILPIVDGK